MTKRNHEIKLKFSEEELQKISNKAKKLSLKTSQYIRMVSLNSSTGVEDES